MTHAITLRREALKVWATESHPFSFDSLDTLMIIFGRTNGLNERVDLPCKASKRIPVQMMLDRILDSLLDVDATLPPYTSPVKGFLWFTRLQAIMLSWFDTMTNATRQDARAGFAKQVEASYRSICLEVIPRCGLNRIDIEDWVILQDITDVPTFERGRLLGLSKRKPQQSVSELLLLLISFIQGVRRR